MAGGTLYLIPTPLGDTPPAQVLPEETRQIAARLDTFIVEHPKSARAFLKRLGTVTPLQELTLLELNEHTRREALGALLEPLRAGSDVGLLSEAGCPAIADPGADLVRLAHRQGIRVRPLVGPSAVLLGLMASGLTGQRFAFHGYLPSKPEARLAAIRDLERRATRDAATQICIETPYRNRALLAALIETCADDTLLTLACDLTGGGERVESRSIADWRRAPAEPGKIPCIFLIDRPR